MSARQMGFFTLAEWQKGLTEIQCDTIDKLQMKLASLNNLLDDQNIFKSIFRYAYDFARVSKTAATQSGTCSKVQFWSLF